MLFSKPVLAAGLVPVLLVLGWDLPGISVSLSLGLPGSGGHGHGHGHPTVTTSCPGGTTTTTTTQTEKGTTITITPIPVETTAVTTVTETAAPTTIVTTSTSTVTDSTDVTTTVTAPTITASLTTTLSCFSSPGVQEGPVLLPSTSQVAPGKRDVATAQQWPPPSSHSKSSHCGSDGAATITKTVTATVTNEPECPCKTTSPGKTKTTSACPSETKRSKTSSTDQIKTETKTKTKFTTVCPSETKQSKTSSTDQTKTQTKTMTTSTLTSSKPTVTSCKTETVTETVTQTLYDTVTAPPTTNTLTSTSTVTSVPTATSTATTTTTVSVGTTATATETPTVSVVAFAQVQPTGIPFYDYYPRTYGTSDNLWSNLSNVVNGLSNNRDYQNTGLIKNVNTLSSNGDSPITLPDGTAVPSSGFSFIFQGYLWPVFGPGSYSVVSRSYYNDDTALMWVGDKALGNNWHYENFDYQQMYPGANGAISTADGVATFTLSANQVMPLTFLFGNVDGPGSSDFVIRFQGTDYVDTSSFFVSDCKGSNNFTP